MTRSAADAATFGEVVGRSLGRSRSAVDALTFNDVVTRAALALLRAQGDALALSDSVARSKGKTIAATDAIHFAEGLVGLRGTASVGWLETIGAVQDVRDRLALMSAAQDGTGSTSTREGVASVSGVVG